MLRIGHRGAAGYVTENTLPSIQKAIDLKANFIEVDIQATRDGHLVIFHDKLLDRLADLNGYLSDYTYKELQRATLTGGHKIPLLKEACPLIAKSNSALLAEMVSFGIEQEILQLLSINLPREQFALASFSHACIKSAKSFDTRTRTVALIEGIPVDLESTIGNCRCDFIGFGFDSISREAVSRSHQLGINVLAWTIDDSREIQRARNLDIDGVITNFPDRVPNT